MGRRMDALVTTERGFGASLVKVEHAARIDHGVIFLGLQGDTGAKCFT